ncbi:MAG: twin-arginine translocase subunit TatC [Gammaproteobacteria bacterium]|nr:twin-arginine translocase subunit TatC [Gammaproteobacteria bacterium]NND53776.1 twin-arginine translocase subunit TatC [Gammaproteobacteria bacterium]
MSDELPDHEPLPDEDEVLEETSLVSHLIELRDRLLRLVVAVLIVFACLLPFTEELFTLVAQPLINELPENSTMIATQVAAPFLTPFKTVLWLAIFIAMPIVIYQIWAFVAPGLYKNEKRFAVPLVVSSIILFYCGVAFAYGVVFPLMFAFFNSVAPEGVAVMTDIDNYLSFVLVLFFAFGMAFEVPIATVMLVWSGLTTPAKLGEARPYVFLGAFVAGMLLTPPDVISQTLLAVPVYLLYEAGIIMARIMLPPKNEDETETAPS